MILTDFYVIDLLRLCIYILYIIYTFIINFLFKIQVGLGARQVLLNTWLGQYGYLYSSSNLVSGWVSVDKLEGRWVLNVSEGKCGSMKPLQVKLFTLVSTIGYHYSVKKKGVAKCQHSIKNINYHYQLSHHFPRG